jgi:lipid-binding SYLF domain-containing protein
MSKLGWAVAAAFAFAGCAGRQPTAQQQLTLMQQADAALNAMVQRDPALHGVLNSAAAYAVFSDIGVASTGDRGAYGHGVLYEHGQLIGEVNLAQASVGVQLGGQTFSELLVLTDPAQVERLKQNQFSLGTGTSAIALEPGASAAADFRNGEAVFVMPRGGLTASIAVDGQQIGYQPFAG